jgi:hypothetical protein
LATGDRPTTVGDDVELVAARFLGRSLTGPQAFLLRVALVVVVLVAFLNLWPVIGPALADWYADVVMSNLPGAASPSQ